MRFSPKAVGAAAFALFSLGTCAAVPGGSYLIASDIPDRSDTALLPQSVIDQAIKEELATQQTIYFPEKFNVSREDAAAVDNDVLDPETRATQPRATSLAELVARRGAASIDGREGECLAGAVYFESKGEPLSGQLAVAEVIMNRAKSGRFASSICGVVFQRGQFSFVRGGGFPPIVRGSQQWKTAVGIAKIAMNKEWSSGVGKALFFHARHVSPGWRLTRVAALGNHVFYR